MATVARLIGGREVSKVEPSSTDVARGQQLEKAMGSVRDAPSPELQIQS